MATKFFNLFNRTKSAGVLDSWITAYGMDAKLLRVGNVVKDFYGDVESQDTTTTNIKIMVQPVSELVDFDVVQYEEDQLPIFAVARTYDKIKIDDMIDMYVPLKVGTNEFKEFIVIENISINYLFDKIKIAPRRGTL